MSSEDTSDNSKEGVQNIPPSSLPSSVPPRLELLLPTDKLIIEQHEEDGWMLTQQPNRYRIMNEEGMRMYIAAETAESWNRSVRTSDRAFSINVLDYSGHTVMNCKRVNRICACDTNSVVHASGQVIGVINQKSGLPLRIHDAHGKEVFTVTGNIFANGRTVFHIRAAGPKGTPGPEVGQIVKESFTKSDTFFVSYPMDLDVRLKGVMIYVTILLDFMFFERDPHRYNDHHH